MKRSQMLEVLNDAIIESGVSENIFNNVKDLDYILTQLEKAGMKPPLKRRDPILLREEHVWEKE